MAKNRCWPLRLDCGCIIEAVGFFYCICDKHDREIESVTTTDEKMVIAQRLADYGL